MKKIDKDEYQKRLDKITALFSDMMVHAEEQSTYRCPYKNRFDECTAQFGCRNQRKPLKEGGLRVCGGDDKIDYRSAWETELEESSSLKGLPGDKNNTVVYGQGTITHDGETRKLAAGKTIFDYADDLAVHPAFELPDGADRPVDQGQVLRHVRPDRSLAGDEG